MKSSAEQCQHLQVAPFTGAWIEISQRYIGLCVCRVASFTGAWIEIGCSGTSSGSARSLPSRERGLKFKMRIRCGLSDWSLPSRERGLKSLPVRLTDVAKKSLPSRERGLKFVYRVLCIVGIVVAPFTGAWIEIGVAGCSGLSQRVAPFTGAWIEITCPTTVARTGTSRSLHGSVDRNAELITPALMSDRRSLHGSVD